MGGVTYTRRSYYYDREFSDSIVARSTDSNYYNVGDAGFGGDDGSGPFMPYSPNFSVIRRGRTLNGSTALAVKDKSTHVCVLQPASGDSDENVGSKKKLLKGVLGLNYEGKDHAPPVQELPPTPLISRLAASPSGYANGRVEGDEDGDPGFTLAGVDVKTIAQGIRFLVRVAEAYQWRHHDSEGNSEVNDNDDGVEEDGGGLRLDFDPYYLEAGPPQRYRQRASPSRMSSARKTSLRALGRSNAGVGASESAQGHMDTFADGAISRSLLPPLEAARRVCYYLIAAAVFGIIASFGIAVWWSRSQGDASAGFTIGGYVIAVDALIVAIAGIVHRPGCRCWKV